MAANYTAVIQRDGEWWIGWVLGSPRVNSQGHTREEIRGPVHVGSLSADFFCRISMDSVDTE